MKINRKQDRSVLYQVCGFFRVDRKIKMAAPVSDWLRHFRLPLVTCKTEFIEIDRNQDLKVLYYICVSWADRKNKMAVPILIGWDIFNFSFETAELNSTKLRLQSLYFSGRSVNKNGRPADSAKKVAQCTQEHDMWLFLGYCFCFIIFFFRR